MRFSIEAVKLLGFSFISFNSISILSVVSLKFLSIMLLMFSSESENFKKYAHFHKEIYITASRLGTDKTMIPMSISSPFRADQTQ